MPHLVQTTSLCSSCPMGNNPAQNTALLYLTVLLMGLCTWMKYCLILSMAPAVNGVALWVDEDVRERV